MINGWASHQPVLFDAISRTSGPILELGAGDFSTRQIDELAIKRGLRVWTIDGYKEWLDKFADVRSDRHILSFLSPNGLREFFLQDSTKWGVVFIDYGDWNIRVEAMLKYKDTAEYLVMHDCDYFAANGMFGTEIEPLNNFELRTGKRDYSDMFKWWIEFFVEGWEQYIPPTLLASNTVSLDGITIEGMIVSGRNA